MDSILFNSELCDFCIKVNHFITTPRQKLSSENRYTSIVWTGLSSQCLFCDQVNEYLRGTGRYQHWPIVTDDKETRCDVYVRHSSLGDETGLQSEVFLRVNNLDIWLEIWADEGSTLPSQIKYKFTTFTHQTTGSRAAEFVISRPPIIEDPSERGFQLIQKWLSVCSETHSNCKKCPYSFDFIDEDEVYLPTRILKIDAKKEQPAVRLIDSHGMKGRYCALSYCWGSPEKMPLRSTTSNIHEHFEKFEWDKLPKTFQDSIILSSKLGIEYLWIDSLCIIQNDAADWSREASRMGSLYKNAYLVIVASGSSDSMAGLFIGDRPKIPSFTLPLRGFEDNTQTDAKHTDAFRGAAGIYHLMFARPDEMKSPKYGPLAQRGWALQEWHLARRRVSFMPGGMTWSCASEQRNERGFAWDLDMWSNMSWAHFLEDYTGRKLTYHLDRLKAVEGVAHEMKTGGREGYNNGIWADDCISDVLWIELQHSHEKDDLRNLPSWSWASTGGPKDWLLKNIDKTSYELVSTTSMMDANSLFLSGQFITADAIESHLNDCCVTALILSTWEDRIDMIRMEVPQLLLAADWFCEPNLRFHRLLLEFRATQSLRGLALMDSVPRDQHEISCILLARIDLDESESQPDSEPESEPESDEEPDEESDEEPDEEPDEDSDEESDKESDSMYSGVLVTHHDKVSQNLRRVNIEG